MASSAMRSAAPRGVMVSRQSEKSCFLGTHRPMARRGCLSNACMWKQIFAACTFGLAAQAWADGGLTDTESRWLNLSWPAVTYAREQGLPLDIVVQPQPTPGNAPMAMAFVDGRCKLVLSMRGNPDAQATLDEIPGPLLTPVVEAMAAHELGHCWRYARGAWHTVPAGFASTRQAETADPQLGEQLREMQQTRREEAFADLVGLAWTLQHHPKRYAEVHAWLMNFRRELLYPGSHHDTLAWIQLAADAGAFSTADRTADTPFDQAWPLWQQGLRAGE
ncbi:MAG: hypothetical protein ABI605_11210 [Rhizobacter sp.]